MCLDALPLPLPIEGALSEDPGTTLTLPSPGGHRRQDQAWRGMWHVVSHVLPPGGGGDRWGVSLGVPPILTFLHQGGREITPLAVRLSALPGAYAPGGRGKK